MQKYHFIPYTIYCKPIIGPGNDLGCMPALTQGMSVVGSMGFMELPFEGLLRVYLVSLCKCNYIYSPHWRYTQKPHEVFVSLSFTATPERVQYS